MNKFDKNIRQSFELPIHRHLETSSTNTLAKEAPAEGPVWELFVTDRQAGSTFS